jgi:heme A synthase
VSHPDDCQHGANKEAEDAAHRSNQSCISCCNNARPAGVYAEVNIRDHSQTAAHLLKVAWEMLHRLLSCTLAAALAACACCTAFRVAPPTHTHPGLLTTIGIVLTVVSNSALFLAVTCSMSPSGTQ